ncbi:hypothetical protein E2C01_083945 [Portunus trituberculatus]|uniref:Uncharacterized protein n=1 Tax=Portunus trituberculatus TaxID=210409 RepID=A0A5B7J660_PORTR|nr:hypothetical protein [Portunus trituberculatus]
MVPCGLPGPALVVSLASARRYVPLPVLPSGYGADLCSLFSRCSITRLHSPTSPQVLVRAAAHRHPRGTRSSGHNSVAQSIRILHE